MDYVPIAGIIGLVFLGLVAIPFFVMGARDWGGPGAADEENNYCERVRTGRMIKQPVNTWSNIGFICMGLGMLFYIDAYPDGSSSPNPMTYRNLFTVLYGLVVIWLGPGSMFLHASQKVWGGWLDNLSMNMFVTFVLCYETTRIFDLGVVPFVILWMLLNVGLGLLTWFWKWDYTGILTFAVVIALVIAAEIYIGIEETPRQGLWMIGVGVAMGLATVIWIFSKTGMPLCKPDSIWQGHAAWHLLTALATLFILLYLRSEGAT
ncbi:MAG: ceramidase domain-containing protein [Planctomycetota bacterium]|jgi:hypothetical protein